MLRKNTGKAQIKLVEPCTHLNHTRHTEFGKRPPLAADCTGLLPLCYTHPLGMSSPASRKRKADALEADGNNADDNSSKSSPSGPNAKSPNAAKKSRAAAPADDDSPTHLPAPCLAAILNFMWYTDVRQCMLAGTMIAVEAAQHVETLNITKSSELVVPAARRFTNVSEVNILCLVSEHQQDDGDDYDILSRDTATQTVPFIASFPHLARVFIGGHYCRRGVWDKHTYELERCQEPSDHEAIFAFLVQSFAGGFQSRALNTNLWLEGVIDGNQLDQLRCSDTSEDPDNPCHCCRGVASHYPISSLISAGGIITRNLCLPRRDIFRAIIVREGAETVVEKDAVIHMLLESLGDTIPRMIWVSSGDEIDKAFEERMLSQGAEHYFLNALRMMWDKFHNPVTESLSEFLDMVQSSSLLKNAMKDIPRSSIESCLSFKRNRNGKKEIFARSVLDKLLAAGLNLDENDYVIVDPENEPALQRLL